MNLLANDYSALEYAISLIDAQIASATKSNNQDLVEELKQHRDSLYDIFANKR